MVWVFLNNNTLFAERPNKNVFLLFFTLMSPTLISHVWLLL